MSEQLAVGPQLQSILEAIDEVVYEVEVGPAGELNVTYISPGFERVLGGRTDPDASLAEAWMAAVHPDDRPVVEEAMRHTRAGEDYDAEYRMLGFDGTERTVWVRHRGFQRAGFTVGAGVLRDVTEARARDRELRELVAEQAALRRVAETVARAADPQEVFTAVAEEVQQLLGVPADAIARMDADGSHQIVAACGIDPAEASALCEGMWRHGDGLAAGSWRAGEDFGFDDSSISEIAEIRAYAAAGVRSYASTPVFAGGRFWGVLALGSPEPSALDAHGKERLRRLAGLVGVALDNAEHRRLLAEAATSDSLTGLSNHRLFHEELAREVARARRNGDPLAIALIDVDHFKAINDSLGHQSGDTLLRSVATLLRSAAREGEVVARLGGDEFAVILPRTDDVGAECFGARVRELVGQTTSLAELGVTLSVGVCDLDHARDGEELVRFADGALYWVKAHGRDAVCRYRQEVVDVLSADERAERLARSQAHTALRSLARAMDVKDPSTHRHSERVADLADRFAVRDGWSDRARLRLRAAALLHDVGKIAVPDRILHKPGPLVAEEYEVIKEHAVVGARVAAEALDAEQVSWIRHHHERWDGAGYPDGLAGDAIPVGAQILALVDAFDVMTHSRHYREPLSVDGALEEVRRHRGTQFCPFLVDGLPSVLRAAAEPLA